MVDSDLSVFELAKRQEWMMMFQHVPVNGLVDIIVAHLGPRLWDYGFHTLANLQIRDTVRYRSFTCYFQSNVNGTEISEFGFDPHLPCENNWHEKKWRTVTPSTVDPPSETYGLVLYLRFKGETKVRSYEFCGGHQKRCKLMRVLQEILERDFKTPNGKNQKHMSLEIASDWFPRTRSIGYQNDCYWCGDSRITKRIINMSQHRGSDEGSSYFSKCAICNFELEIMPYDLRTSFFN